MTYGTYNPNIPRPTYSSIIGKPFPTVSSKGISNGLSDRINDGMDFGPDTMYNATSPDQTGPPYSKTSGLKEAINYAVSTQPFPYHYPGVKIYLSRGDFYLNEDVPIYNPYVNGSTTVNSVTLVGEGHDNTFLIINAEGMNGLVITTEGSGGEGFSFENLGIYLSPSLSPNTVNSLVELAGNGSPKINFISCKFNTSGNSGFSNTNILINGGIYQPTGGTDTRLIFIGCTFNGANVYNDTSNNETTFIGCDWNQGIPVNVTAIYRAAYYFASMSFIGCNINAHIQLQGSRTVMMLVSGGDMGGAIYVTGGSHFIHIDTVYWALFSGDTAYVEISSGVTLPSLIIEGTYFLNQVNLVTPSATVNYFKFSSAIAVAGYMPIMNVVTNTSISANPPVSGTVYQNTNGYDIRLKIPVTYSPTASAAATLATGISPTSPPTTSTKVNIPAGLTAADGEILTYEMVVPAGWYYELVATNATIGTAEVQTA